MGEAFPVIEDVTAVQVLTSLTLVVLAGALSAGLGHGLTRRLATAAVRAAVQLLAVGLLFGFIVEADRSMALAWLWVTAMVVITSVIARRRAPNLPGGGPIAAAAVGFTVAGCLAVIFGVGVLAYEPVNLIVVAGITIGNSMPSQVLGSNRLTSEVRDNRGQVEALLALGMSPSQVVKITGGRIVQTALIPQIERTNVVGLIALPGAMTGLLLAGADPVDAVLVQIIVMYLVLGAVATSVIVTVVAGLYRLFSPDRRLLPIPTGD